MKDHLGEVNPVDELARAAEALRRADERRIDALKACEVACSVADKAQAAHLAACDEVERIRGQVKALAAKIATG